MYNKTGHCYVTKGISKIIHGKFWGCVEVQG